MEIPKFEPSEYRKEVADDLKRIKDHNERKSVWEKKKQTPSYKVSKEDHLKEVSELEADKMFDNLYSTFETEKYTKGLWDKTPEINNFLNEKGIKSEEKLTREILFEVFGKFSPNVATEKNACFCGGGGKAMEQASELMKNELKELLKKRLEIIRQHQPALARVEEKISYLKLNNIRYLRLLHTFLEQHGIKYDENDYIFKNWDNSAGGIEESLKRLLETSTTKK